MPDKENKTFDPTPQRLRKAREEGNVFRAREMVSLGMLASGMGLLLAGAPAAFMLLRQLMRTLFLQAPLISLTPTAVVSLMKDISTDAFKILLPFFLILSAMALGLNIVQSGWNVAPKTLIPKFSRINPLEGFKRIFSSKGLIELLKGLLKMAFIFPIVYLTFSKHWEALLTLPTRPLMAIAEEGMTWMLIMLAQIIGVLSLIIGADFAYQKWKFKQDLKMSFQEIKDEAKESEGDPQLKVRRKQMALEMSRRPRLDHAIFKADVVVTNPTHYAVALRYDPEEREAPYVLAKGVRKRALRIKALALEHGIPVIEDPPLARALYHNVPEEAEIPAELYPAVATILAEIYRSRGHTY